jgi:hypothetical protein
MKIPYIYAHLLTGSVWVLVSTSWFVHFDPGYPNQFPIVLQSCAVATIAAVVFRGLIHFFLDHEKAKRDEEHEKLAAQGEGQLILMRQFPELFPKIYPNYKRFKD